MKISVICGSHREHSQSHKVGRFIANHLLNTALAEEVYLLNLASNPLPLWDESIWAGNTDWEARLAPIRHELQTSDGLVVISPEWHGMVPSGLKNFFLMWGRGELAHKPGLIVAVSSGDGGAYPIAELRMSSYKNNRLCYLPEHVIVRHAESVLNEDVAKNNVTSDAYIRERLHYALGILREYAVALKQVRASGVTDLSVYKNGM